MLGVKGSKVKFKVRDFMTFLWHELALELSKKQDLTKFKRSTKQKFIIALQL